MKKISLALAGILSCLVLLSQKNIQQLGRYTYGNGVVCSNLTGYAGTSGKEYALVGTSQGLSIVDITNPATPAQLFLVPGATGQGGSWREVREYKGYAYVTTEAQSGLVVVNLNYLPDSISYHTVRPGGMNTSHTIFIDEKGIAYINGTDKGQLFLNLNTDPWNPPLLGKFTNNYVHDCFVRNDTMWAACINDGYMKAVDVSDKANADAPTANLGSWETPLKFSHNAWPGDDGKYIFTTDEKPASFLACYDVANLNNVTETDRTQVLPGSNTVIHNTYFMNDYCITSYYTYGITIHDVKRKNNLVEVGNFDTAPSLSGNGFNGAWGVWPYLPSGNIIVSDIQNGLWILGPTYKRACYVEGVVKDSLCNTLLNNVTIEIVGNGVTDITNITGKYSTGTPDSGTYTIRFSKPGYQTVQYNNVSLNNGVLTAINVAMFPVSTCRLVVKTVDETTGHALPLISTLIQDTLGNTYQQFSTDNTGEYTFCDFVQGTYSFYAGAWGKITMRVNKTINTSIDTILLQLSPGYYDDFILDYGWTEVTAATSGDWERGKPEETEYNNNICNPGADITGDFGRDCYVTGNNGGDAGNDDVDDGYTILQSPAFDISAYGDPYLSYYRWFFNDGGTGSPPNDSLIVYLANANDTMRIDAVGPGSSASQWRFKNIRVKDFIATALPMGILFFVRDYNQGHLVEAAVDVFSIVDSAGGVASAVETISSLNDLLITAHPNVFGSTTTVYFKSSNQMPATLSLYNTTGELLKQFTITEEQTHLQIGAGLASGMYFLKARQGNLGATIKLVKL